MCVDLLDDQPLRLGFLHVIALKQFLPLNLSQPPHATALFQPNIFTVESMRIEQEQNSGAFRAGSCLLEEPSEASLWLRGLPTFWRATQINNDNSHIVRAVFPVGTLCQEGSNVLGGPLLLKGIPGYFHGLLAR